MDKRKKVTFRPLMRKDGTSEFEEFFQDLPTKDRQKLLLIIHQTETEGLQIAIRQKWVKKLGDDLYELRSKVGTNIQRALYFQKVGTEYLITHGFTKKTQKTPTGEIKHAKALRDKYKRGDLL